MTYTLVQTSITTSSSQCTIPASTIGNLGFITLCMDQTTAITAINGSGAAWDTSGSQNDAANGQNVISLWGIYGSSVTSLVYNNAGAVALTVSYCEFNSSTGWNATPLRTANVAKAFTTATTATDNATSNNITPNAGDLVVCAYGDTSGNQASIVHGTGWTTGVVQIGAPGTGASAAEWMTAPGGSQNGTFTVGTGGHNYTNQIYAFAPGGSPPPATGSFFRLM